MCESGGWCQASRRRGLRSSRKKTSRLSGGARGDVSPADMKINVLVVAKAGSALQGCGNVYLSLLDQSLVIFPAPTCQCFFFSAVSPPFFALLFMAFGRAGWSACLSKITRIPADCGADVQQMFHGFVFGFHEQRNHFYSHSSHKGITIRMANKFGLIIWYKFGLIIGLDAVYRSTLVCIWWSQSFYKHSALNDLESCETSEWLPMGDADKYAPTVSGWYINGNQASLDHNSFSCPPP